MNLRRLPGFSEVRAVPCALLLPALLLAGCGGGGSEDASLSSLSVTAASGRPMYPGFAAGIKHYALGCDPQDVLTVSATSTDARSNISIDGVASATGNAHVDVVHPSGDQDILVKVSNGDATQQYTLHCLAQDFPNIDILHADAPVSAGLLLLSPSYTVAGQPVSYLIVMDNDGVPRFRRRISGSVADFKRHADGSYSYALRIGTDVLGNPNNVIVLLDKTLAETERTATVGLSQTDNHDFLLTPQGNRIFISYDAAIRDMSAFGLSTSENVGDSVIQEVTPGGAIVFQWNSWDHIDLADCKRTGYTRFPLDYGHLNSLDLTDTGDLIASFRGCGQILKIARPSGNVIWYLGGSRSTFAIVGDPFNEFCGQHTAREIPGGSVVLFDNGIFCLGDRESRFGHFSRAVEYRLNVQTAQAVFVRDYSLGGTYREFTSSQGSVQKQPNGNWLVSWGNGPAMSVTEVTQAGVEVFAAKLTYSGSIAVSYRALRDNTLTLD